MHHDTRRWLTLSLGLLAFSMPHHALADSTPQTLPFSQDWSDPNQIDANDVWSGVPGIEGFRGDGLTAVTGVDPQSVRIPTPTRCWTSMRTRPTRTVSSRAV